jgi:hypothetical protein
VDPAGWWRAPVAKDTVEVDDARRHELDIRVFYEWWIVRQLWDRLACYGAWMAWVLKGRARLCIRWDKMTGQLKKVI